MSSYLSEEQMEKRTVYVRGIKLSQKFESKVASKSNFCSLVQKYNYKAVHRFITSVSIKNGQKTMRFTVDKEQKYKKT